MYKRSMLSSGEVNKQKKKQKKLLIDICLSTFFLTIYVGSAMQILVRNFATANLKLKRTGETHVPKLWSCTRLLFYVGTTIKTSETPTQ